MNKKIAILGSTGSIGTTALDIARHLKIPVVAIAAQKNIDLLEKQAKEFQPECIAVYDRKQAAILRQRLPQFTVLEGMEGLSAVATHSSANLTLAAISGALGITPTLAAIRAKKDIALANKEVLVAAGELIMGEVKKHKIQMIPVDSEHSALFQCLNGESLEAVNRLILTASGGPFRNYSADQLATVTTEQALNHPNWKMGPKVTIDSSTLMNKGLEVIEAYWLFAVPLKKIEVVLHPQSIIHSMVEYVDGSILAQMGEPHMATPIQYALTFPERKPGLMKPFDFIRFGKLEFSCPDLNRFRCLKLAFDALQVGESMPCCMNAANEILVNRFLQHSITWQEIAQKLETLMNRHKVQQIDSLEAIFEVDRCSRLEAATI